MVILYGIGAILALAMVVCAAFFMACYLVIREVTIFILRCLHESGAAKSNRG